MRAVIEAFDARTDDRRREIEVSPGRIVIWRRVSGVQMRVALRPEQYRGVALSVLVAEGSDFLYCVKLAHADPGFDVMLGAFDREPAARTAWRRWASALNLLRLIERGEGEYEVDRAPPTTPIERRRGRATLRRRNRFLARRKMGQPTRASDAATALGAASPPYSVL